MGITNYKIDAIEGKVSKRDNEAMDVKESFAITEVKKTNNQMLEVSWTFTTDYKNVGKLALEGTLMYFTKTLADKYEEKTVKGKKVLVLTGDALMEVSNFILRRGIIESVILSKTLQLPAPIQLPSVKIEKKA